MLSPADTFLPWDLTDFEQVTARRFPHRCSIRRVTPTPDGSGGWVDTASEIQTVPCALTRMLTPREILSGSGVAGISDWRLLLPNDTDLQSTDDVLPWWEWRVSLGPATAGTFTLIYGGHTTAAIAYNALADAVSVRLSALPSIGAGNVVVSGTPGGPYRLRLVGARAANEAAITASFAGLTAGDGVIERPAFSVIGIEDMATDQPQMTAYLTRRR